MAFTDPAGRRSVALLTNSELGENAGEPLNNALNMALCGEPVTPLAGQDRAAATLTPTVPFLDRPLAEHWSTR